MAFWISFWGAVLALGIAAFTVLAVVVTVGGFADVKAMFRNLETHHEQDGEG
jgi:hypothetical protein